MIIKVDIDKEAFLLLSVKVKTIIVFQKLTLRSHRTLLNNTIRILKKTSALPSQLDQPIRKVPPGSWLNWGRNWSLAKSQDIRVVGELRQVSSISLKGEGVVRRGGVCDESGKVGRDVSDERIYYFSNKLSESLINAILFCNISSSVCFKHFRK